MNTNINLSLKNTHSRKKWGLILVAVWVLNCILATSIAIHEIWLPKMNAAGKAYTSVRADAFDGTSLPITHIPNWKKSSLQNKSLDFRNIAMSDIIPIPRYNTSILANPNNLIERFTYTVTYMGSYTLNYKENDGSHLGVDIRAPIGTPVLSIANGVVVRAVEADASGNKFVVIRHENVPYNGKTVDLYSGYLHLSEIVVAEGSKIRKGEMLGRVGITGITTTPHLHFQIDTADAPFHPYWPYTGAEARAAGLTFLQAVTAGLGADKGRKYTINPMEFVQFYLSGNLEKKYTETIPAKPMPVKSLDEIVDYIKPEVESAPVIRSLEDLVNFTDISDKNENIVVASSMVHNSAMCKNMQTSHVDFNQALAELADNNCPFDEIENLSANTKLTRAEALSVLMRYNRENPDFGISPFLDVAIGDTKTQGWAARAFNKNIFTSDYLRPYDTLTRAEFIEILGRFGRLNAAPTNYVAYNDLGRDSTLYKNLQNFGYTIGVQNRNFFPNRDITQYEAAKFLSYLK